MGHLIKCGIIPPDVGRLAAMAVGNAGVRVSVCVLVLMRVCACVRACLHACLCVCTCAR